MFLWVLFWRILTTYILKVNLKPLKVLCTSSTWWSFWPFYNFKREISLEIENPFLNSRIPLRNDKNSILGFYWRWVWIFEYFLWLRKDVFVLYINYHLVIYSSTLFGPQEVNVCTRGSYLSFTRCGWRSAFCHILCRINLSF